MIMADVNESSLKEMDGLVGEGITSFKLFMAYPGVFYSDDGQVLRAMQRAPSNGGLIMMHAENGIAIDVLVEQALAAGQTDPRYHGEVRHALLEAEATHRAIKLAQVAGRAAVHRARVGRGGAGRGGRRPRRGATTSSPRPARSTCSCPPTTWPSPDFEGAKYVCSTPLRPREHQAALWRGLRTNDLSVVSTDHCPFCFKGQKELGRGDFSKIPNGLPGVENRMDLLHQARGRRAHHPPPLDRDRLRHPGADVRPVPAARARSPRARTPTSSSTTRPRRRSCRPATHHMNVDYSCYEGRRVTGRVRTVLSRGRVIVDAGEYRGAAGHGRFLTRDTCQYLR